MPFLDAAELADIRADMDTLLVDTAQVQRPTETRDSGGGTIDTFTPGATFKCRAWNDLSTVAESDIGDGILATATWRVRVSYGSDVRDTDRLLITPAVGSAFTLEVVAGTRGRSDPFTALFLCKKLGD